MTEPDTRPGHSTKDSLPGGSRYIPRTAHTTDALSISRACADVVYAEAAAMDPTDVYRAPSVAWGRLRVSVLIDRRDQWTVDIAADGGWARVGTYTGGMSVRVVGPEATPDQLA